MAPQAHEPPKEYLCPNTLGLMSDPVIASDDHTCASPQALECSAAGGLDEALGRGGLCCSWLLCNVGRMLMHADERAALELWLDRSDTSPVTRQRLAPGFRWNLALRQLIQAWEQA